MIKVLLFGFVGACSILVGYLIAHSQRVEQVYTQPIAPREIVETVKKELTQEQIDEIKKQLTPVEIEAIKKTQLP